MPANREFVRKFDRDRYLCTLFADRHDQEFLFTIYALYNELANIPFRIQEPKLGEIRLQWWRENLSELNTKIEQLNESGTDIAYKAECQACSHKYDTSIAMDPVSFFA